jgi:membrane-associated phospholipid phosphatase
MIKKLLIVTLLAIVMPMRSMAQQTARVVDYSTDAAMFIPAAMGLGVAIYEGDTEGAVQLGKTLAVSTAVTYILKYSVKKARPDGTGFDAFPSNHCNFAFGGATFLQRRYGWKWGVPAYLVSAYVAWGRIYAKKHDVWDVLAGAAISVGSGFLFTTPFAKKHNVQLAPIITSEGGCGVYFSMTL